jgi:hypothetical protein
LEQNAEVLKNKQRIQILKLKKRISMADDDVPVVMVSISGIAYRRQYF